MLKHMILIKNTVLIILLHWITFYHFGLKTCTVSIFSLLGTTPIEGGGQEIAWRGENIEKQVRFM